MARLGTSLYSVVALMGDGRRNRWPSDDHRCFGPKVRLVLKRNRHH